jgi:mannosyltransferase
LGSFVKNYGTLAAILLLAAFLRIYQLGAESLWIDEGVSLIKFAHLGEPSEIIELTKTDTDRNFPIYYLILHYWVALFGDSEFSVRFPSALAGILAVFAMYKVGRLLFGRGPGLMASLILTLSPFHIYYSQEARAYSLMSLLTLFSFYFFLKILSERKLVLQTGYVLSTSALTYSHVYSLFVLIAQNIYLATMFLGRAFGLRGKARPGFWEWVVLQALLFVLYIPGLVLLAGWLSNPRLTPWAEKWSLDWLYDEVLLGYSGSPLLLALLLAFSLLAGVALVRESAADKLYLLLLWLLIPVAIPIAIESFVTYTITDAKYSISASLALYLLAAKGIGVASSALPRAITRETPAMAWRARTVWLVIAAVLIVLFSRELRTYFTSVDKDQWREAAKYVEAHAQPNDLILVEGSADNEMLFDHYVETTDVETDRARSFGGGRNKPGIEKYDRVWHVSIVDSTRKADRRLNKSFFERTHTQTDREEYVGLALTLYEKEERSI